MTGHPVQVRRLGEPSEALQWDGHDIGALSIFLGGRTDLDEWTWDATEGSVTFHLGDGDAVLTPGDWLVRAPDGTVSAHRPDVFETAYGAL